MEPIRAIIKENKIFGALPPLLFIGPSVIYNAFMNPTKCMALPYFSDWNVACLADVFDVYGIKIIIESLFND
jgi:hypothetical protein